MENFREIGPLGSILLHSPCFKILTLRPPFSFYCKFFLQFSWSLYTFSYSIQRRTLISSEHKFLAMHKKHIKVTKSVFYEQFNWISTEIGTQCPWKWMENVPFDISRSSNLCPKTFCTLSLQFNSLRDEMIQNNQLKLHKIIKFLDFDFLLSMVKSWY